MEEINYKIGHGRPIVVLSALSKLSLNAAKKLSSTTSLPLKFTQVRKLSSTEIETFVFDLLILN